MERNWNSAGDYTAIIILYYVKKTKVSYVIVADIARHTPDQAIDRIVKYARMYDIHKFGVEANQFQELMVDNLKRRLLRSDTRVSIEKITSRSNKQARIANLEPEVTQGKILFSRRPSTLLDQLRQFPMAQHDDGPDALEMAVTVARDSGYGYTVEPLLL